MERISLNNLRDGATSLGDNNNNNKKIKDSWRGDLLGGFSWPPRSYACSFCKREFRSAQALGGHMNVHRRDRARLKQLPPLDAQCSKLNPNPNPNFPSYFHSTRLPPLTYTFPCLSSSSSNEGKILSFAHSTLDPSYLEGEDFDFTKSAKTLFGVGQLKGFMQQDQCKNLKGEIVTMDLEIGLRSKEALDLELRLGYT